MAKLLRWRRRDATLHESDQRADEDHHYADRGRVGPAADVGMSLRLLDVCWFAPYWYSMNKAAIQTAAATMPATALALITARFWLSQLRTVCGWSTPGLFRVGAATRGALATATDPCTSFTAANAVAKSIV